MEETSRTNMRKILIGELIRGRDCTTKLQNLFHGKVVDGAPVSIEDLVMKITKSFSNNLSTLNSWHMHGRTLKSGERERKSPRAVKDGRGCYKRRETEDSRVKIASTYDDGYAWRKYGQKEILNAKFPRCYYRCTYKDEGCKALKQVQKLEDGSQMFRITYIGSHTCHNMNENIPMFLDSKAHRFSLSNFEDSKINYSPSSISTNTSVHITPSFGKKDYSNTQNGKYRASSSQGTPTNCMWDDMITDFELSYDDIFKDDNDSDAQLGNYLASSNQGTSSNHVWESDLELSYYDDLFQYEDYTEDLKF